MHAPCDAIDRAEACARAAPARVRAGGRHANPFDSADTLPHGGGIGQITGDLSVAESSGRLAGKRTTNAFLVGAAAPRLHSSKTASDSTDNRTRKRAGSFGDSPAGQRRDVFCASSREVAQCDPWSGTSDSPARASIFDSVHDHERQYERTQQVDAR
jgi:hypothetical protein